MVHCGFYSEYGGFKISKEDKNYMQSCKVVVSTCAFGGGDDLYQPIGMSESSLRKVTFIVQKSYLLGIAYNFTLLRCKMFWMDAGLLCCILG
jgi:hypothetical protein